MRENALDEARRRRALAVIAAVAMVCGCAYRDPLFCRESRDCVDPERPVCDLTGALPGSNGSAQTCVPDPDAGDDGAEHTVSIAAGYFHVCALSSWGNVRCWGSNVSGQLGYGVPTNVGDDETPFDLAYVDVGDEVEALAAGGDHTCAILASGGLRCWGRNNEGQLGYGHTANIGLEEAPADADELDVGFAVAAIRAGGDQTCARSPSGAVRCWGLSIADGVPGPETFGDDEPASAAPTVELGDSVFELSTGSAHNCAVFGSGNLRCWGFAGNGRLGYGNAESIGDDELPVDAGTVPGISQVVAVSAGAQHTCATLDTGGAKCWGRGSLGRLGLGNTTTVGDDETLDAVPEIALLGDASAIAAGVDHTCAVLGDRRVQCWGNNASGALGYGHLDRIGDDETPASAGTVSVGGRVSEIEVGLSFTCALLINGDVQCWGNNISGQLGYGHTEDIGDDDSPSGAGNVRIWE